MKLQLPPRFLSAVRTHRLQILSWALAIVVLIVLTACAWLLLSPASVGSTAASYRPSTELDQPSVTALLKRFQSRPVADVDNLISPFRSSTVDNESTVR